MDPKPPSEPPESQSENHPPPPEPPKFQPENHRLAPESPELKSHPQPPINPNSNTSTVHDHQERQRQSRTMENFKAKLMEYAQVTRMPPGQKLLIEKGFNDFFPNDLYVPNHPPYREMIHGAIKELNQEGGSNEEAISIHIRDKYNDLPWAHGTLLRLHLGKLCETGDVVVTSDKCYMLNHEGLTFNPRPRPSLSLIPIDIPINGSSSSPSPCSSSTASYSPSPKRRQRKRTRKRKYGKKRGRPRKKLESEEEFEDTEEEESEETEEEEFEEFVSTEEEREATQVENQVIQDQNRRQTRSGGRSMQPKKYESEENSQSDEKQMGMTGVRNQVIEYQKSGRKPARRRGRPRTKFGIETNIRPKAAQKEVIEAQNQVTEDQKRLKQGRGQGRPRGRPRRQNEIQEEFQASEQIEVIKAENQVIKDQIEVIEKQNQPKEEKEDSFEEQNQLKGLELDVIEEQNQVPKQQDEVFDKQNQSEKENAAITSESLTQGEVFEDWKEQKKQEIGVDEEQTQPEVQNDVMEGKNKAQEQKSEGILQQDKFHEQYIVISELGQQQEQLEDKEVIERQHHVVMIRSEAQVQVGVIEELNGIQKKFKGACVEQNSSVEQNDVSREISPSQGEHIEVIKDQSQPGQIQCGEIVEQDPRLEQEIEVARQGQHVEQKYGLIKKKNPLEEVSNMVERMVLQSCDDGENILGKVSPIFPCKSPRLVTEEEIKKSLKKEREQQMKSPLEEGELFDTSDWTQHPEWSPELRTEKLSWIPDQLPQQETEDESNPCQFHFQTPRPETDTHITMKKMVPSQIMHEEQQPVCIGEGGVPKFELVTTMAESSSLSKYQHGDVPDGQYQLRMLGVERFPETATSTEVFHSEYQHISHQQQLEQPKHQGCEKPRRPTPYTDENTESSQMQ